MGRALSVDLRLRVVQAIDGGLTTREAARRFAIGIATAGAWHRLWRRTGSVAPGRQGPPVHSKLDAHEAFIMALVEADRDITLTEIAERLRSDRGVEASRALVWYFFDKRGVTFKKKSAHAAEQDRPDVARRRQAWFDGQLDLDPSRLIFIDETGTNTKMARLRGRSLRGERCRASVPHGHWKTMTFTAGIRMNGLVAPFVLDGAMDADAFRAYVARVLVHRDDRKFLEAVLYFTVSDISWRALPPEFGPWSAVWKRFSRLSKAGVFEAMFDHLAATSERAHLVHLIDSTIARAHVAAAGAKGGKTVRR